MVKSSTAVVLEQLTEEERKRQDQARLLRALADSTRLKILHILKKQQGTITVEEVVEAINCLAQPTISHHLRIMRDAGLVEVQKQGLHAYYFVRRDTLRRIEEVITGLQETSE